jgi:hypothetical protein
MDILRGGSDSLVDPSGLTGPSCQTPWGPKTRSRPESEARHGLRQCCAMIRSLLYLVLRRTLGLVHSERPPSEARLPVSHRLGPTNETGGKARCY